MTPVVEATLAHRAPQFVASFEAKFRQRRHGRLHLTTVSTNERSLPAEHVGLTGEACEVGQLGAELVGDLAPTETDVRPLTRPCAQSPSQPAPL